MSMQALTPTLSRFAGEGAIECGRFYRVPSPAERERVRVRACGSIARREALVASLSHV
jgi:hypothetical protein